MIQEKYLEKIKGIILKVIPQAKIFVFGSSVESNHFADVDIGIDGVDFSGIDLSLIKENLENSNLPYKIDIVDFQKVAPEFKDKIFKTKILWLT